MRLGKAVKVALDKDEQGTARTWIEFKVTQDKDERPIGPPISFSTGLFR